MKKRILSFLMTLVICFTLLPSAAAFAATNEQDSNISSFAAQPCSTWAKSDLAVGITYGIYPSDWTSSDMTAPITQAEFRVLLAGLRNKILNTNCVTETAKENVKLKKYQTVDEVIKNLYNVAASYTFTKDLKLKEMDYLKFMKDNGIYTGKNGEQKLKSTCSMEQACVMATRLITVVYDQLDAASKGFFYVAKANGNTVYMLGSIHMATNDIYPISDEIIKAYQASDALAVEVNLNNQAGALEFLQAALYKDGTTLKDHVSAETYQKAMALAKAYGANEKMLSMNKPWYIYSMFNSLALTNSGTTEEAEKGIALGVDMYFLTNAIENKKPVLEVEGYDKQGKMLDSFSDGLQEFLLNGVITEINKINSGKAATSSGADGLDAMLAAWKTGDEKEFAPYGSFENEYKDTLTSATTEKEKEYLVELQDKLFTKRDTAMADYIEGLLTSKEAKTYFVVVGGFHYVSNNDVIDMLTKRGYTISQIK
jgi:uncharacterized protein YbaP (TraB family)